MHDHTSSRRPTNWTHLPPYSWTITWWMQHKISCEVHSIYPLSARTRCIHRREGIQGHKDSWVGPIVCLVLDKLGIHNLPIWLMELDVSSTNEYVRADHLEVMLQRAFAHPALEGIMLWGFWEPFTFKNNALSWCTRWCFMKPVRGKFLLCMIGCPLQACSWSNRVFRGFHMGIQCWVCYQHKEDRWQGWVSIIGDHDL